MLLSVIALSLLLSQDPPATNVPDVDVEGQRQSAEEIAAAEREAERNEIVCRNERILGSNLPERVCQRRRDWDEVRQRSIQQMQDGSTRAPQSARESSGVPGVASTGG